MKVENRRNNNNGLDKDNKNSSVFNTVAIIDPKKVSNDTNTRNTSLRRNNQTETYSHQPIQSSKKAEDK
jgi:hypothetical protein